LKLSSQFFPDANSNESEHPFEDKFYFNDDLGIQHKTQSEGQSSQEAPLMCGEALDDVALSSQTVQTVLQNEEDSLFDLHMSIIQENAEFLTEEGKLLQDIQNENVVDDDIDNYASRLGVILDRKTDLILQLKQKLNFFRSQLQREE